MSFNVTFSHNCELPSLTPHRTINEYQASIISKQVLSRKVRMAYKTVGRPRPRIDGEEVAVGSAKYTADVALPGTLWGAVLRSLFPHARITRIDASRAQQAPGVHAVLTGADVRGILYGRRLCDVPILAGEKVRFVGERVAAVAAEDKSAAEEALLLVDVEYEQLPAVFDPLEALKHNAPILHPDVNSYVGLPRPQDTPSNAFVSDTPALTESQSDTGRSQDLLCPRSPVRFEIA